MHLLRVLRDHRARRHLPELRRQPGARPIRPCTAADIPASSERLAPQPARAPLKAVVASRRRIVARFAAAIARRHEGADQCAPRGPRLGFLRAVDLGRADTVALFRTLQLDVRSVGQAQVASTRPYDRVPWVAVRSRPRMCAHSATPAAHGHSSPQDAAGCSTRARRCR